MADPQPDHTAVRTALWRALHVEVDAPPHVLTDEIGLRIAGPEDGWRDRPDMDPDWTSGFRAWMVARARFVEDLVVERGVGQYVLLGAGLDTFAQRTDRELTVFEIDQPEPQAWKHKRLVELGLRVPELVPVDFEAGADWWALLAAAGFDAGRPALVASVGVSMYLTREANADTLRRLTSLAPGSTVVMTFQLPVELVDERDRPGRELAVRDAANSGTPFISFFPPEEMISLAKECGFADATHVSGKSLRYFEGRTDGLRPSSGEDFLVAQVGR